MAGWVQGVVAIRDSLMAEANDAAGRNIIRLEQLQFEGVPPQEDIRIGRFSTRLATWSRPSGGSVNEGTSLASETGRLGARHQVFRLQAGEREVALPALVLMRALLRPNKILLARAFKPQFLELLAAQAVGDDGTVLVNAESKKGSFKTHRRADGESLLAWMTSYSSARAMAASIHDYAMKGRVAMDLPRASFEMAVRCIQLGSELVSTKATIYAVLPEEEAMPDVVGARKRYILRANFVENRPGAAIRIRDYGDVPVRLDGTTFLTDEEWLEVEPLLTQGRSRRNVCRKRSMLNAVLEKAATGRPWRAMNYPHGNYLNATDAFRTWASSGALRQVVERLKSMRFPSDEACA